MTTTALFAELVVGGVQTMGWLFILATLWHSPGRLLSVVRPLSAAEGFILLVFAYALGVVFDRLWDAALKPISQRLKKSILKHPNRADRIRAQLFSTDQPQAAFIDYIRSRLRVTRATLCNSLLAALISASVHFWRASEPWADTLTFVSVFATGVFLLAVFAYRDITHNYYKTLLRLQPFLPKAPRS